MATIAKLTHIAGLSHLDSYMIAAIDPIAWP
jgi:hypothetical protein